MYYLMGPFLYHIFIARAYSSMYVSGKYTVLPNVRTSTTNSLHWLFSTYMDTCKEKRFLFRYCWRTASCFILPNSGLLSCVILLCFMCQPTPLENTPVIIYIYPSIHHYSVFFHLSFPTGCSSCEASLLAFAFPPLPTTDWRNEHRARTLDQRSLNNIVDGRNNKVKFSDANHNRSGSKSVTRFPVCDRLGRKESIRPCAFGAIHGGIHAPGGNVIKRSAREYGVVDFDWSKAYKISGEINLILWKFLWI